MSVSPPGPDAHVKMQTMSSSLQAATQDSALLHAALAAHACSSGQHFCFVQASHAGSSWVLDIFVQSAGTCVPLSVPPLLDVPPLEDPPLLDDAPPSPPAGTVEPLLDEVPSGGTNGSGGSLAHANAMPATDRDATAWSPSFRIHG